jgi:hypothetical protein
VTRWSKVSIERSPPGIITRGPPFGQFRRAISALVAVTAATISSPTRIDPDLWCSLEMPKRSSPM